MLTFRLVDHAADGDGGADGSSTTLKIVTAFDPNADLRSGLGNWLMINRRPLDSWRLDGSDHCRHAWVVAGEGRDGKRRR
jgi:hypothetical protein